MTAGQRWSTERPTVPGWYWWRVDVQDLSLPDVQYDENTSGTPEYYCALLDAGNALDRLAREGG